MTTTTRTLNPLPFDSLDPKRFEDLIRQLAYDFRSWRMLEATGRAGSDEGYDARGFEITFDTADEAQDAVDTDEDVATPQPRKDNIWLIQCKREQLITPAKMKHHLSAIAEDEARNLYGMIFAAACDFSKKTRDIALAWGREHGIEEIHLWGKAEVEDQLFQPKNDHLLFAYFGISLQIRRRSMRTALRAKLTMKRKVMRHLGNGWNDNKVILIRDPEDEEYPYIDEGGDPRRRGWQVTEFAGNRYDGIKLNWRKYYAYLAEDGRRWDCANVYNDAHFAAFQDPWLSEDERERQMELRMKIDEFWRDNIPQNERAHLTVTCFIKYDDIIEIDENGDDVAEFPHVFVSLKEGAPANFFYTVKLIVPARVEEEENGLRRMTEPRTLIKPELSDRIDVFPSEFRKPIR